MFSYYGSKSKLVDFYPAPKYGRIIEPFAGSARYSLKYFDRDVLLVDAYEVVVKIWHFLQQASEKDILSLPNLTYKQSIDDYKLSEGERLLLGFLVARGSRRPAKVVQKFSNIEQDKKRIAKNLFKIRHWVIKHGDYRDIENQDACWFIDPPYQNVGKAGYNVNERGNKIDYTALGEWCKSRKGQVIVCEVTTANWLPFEPLVVQRGQKRASIEAYWVNSKMTVQERLL
jgi:site-specific DNA-adenine methylase